MVELVEYVRHQEWLHLFEPVPSVFENKVREVYYTIKFTEDSLSLFALVQCKKVKLDKETLGKILDVFVIGMRSVEKKKPSVEFIKDSSKVGRTFIAGVRKKFLKEEFRLVYEFVNKVVQARV